MESWDGRCDACLQAVRGLARGSYDVRLEARGEDALGCLERALVELAGQLQRRAEQADSLVRLIERVNAGLTPEEILDFVFDSFRSAIPYDRVSFALLDDDGRTLRVAWARSDNAGSEIPTGFSQDITRSSLQQILSTGQPRLLDDLETYLAEHPESEATRRLVQAGFRSSMACSLVARAKPIGFMFFSSSSRGTYTREHADTFKQIAGSLAWSLERARLYGQVVGLSEARNRLLGMAAHDLRCPLSTMKMSLPYLIDAIRPTEPNLRLLAARLDGLCLGMLATIDELVDIASVESGTLQLSRHSVALEDFLSNCLELCSPLAKAKSMTVRLEVQPELPHVFIDSVRLTRAVSNLVSNAVKFSRRGAEVLLRVEFEGERFSISVCDQGQGIPPDEMPKLFKHFSRTNVQPTEGERSAGLGLAIVKRLVEAHGGSMSVSSEVGKGSCFTMLLPLGASGGP